MKSKVYICKVKFVLQLYKRRNKVKFVLQNIVIFVKFVLQMLVNRVKDFRKGGGLTQEELGNRAGVSRQTIISIEKNKFIPGLDVALKISESLNTPIYKLFYFV